MTAAKTAPDILSVIPDADSIRREIAERAAQIAVLRKLLKVAECRCRLSLLDAAERKAVARA